MAQISGPNAFTGTSPFPGVPILPTPQGYSSAPFESVANPGNLYSVCYENEQYGFVIYHATSRTGSDFAAVYTKADTFPPTNQYYPISTTFNQAAGNLIVAYLLNPVSSGPIEADTPYELYVVKYNVDTGAVADIDTGVTCTYNGVGRGSPASGAVACQFSTGDIGVIYSTGSSGQNSNFLILGGSPVTFVNTSIGMAPMYAVIDLDILYCVYLNGDSSWQPELRTVSIGGSVSAASVIASATGPTDFRAVFGPGILIFGGQIFVCGLLSSAAFNGIFRGDALTSPAWTQSLNVYASDSAICCLCTDGTNLYAIWNSQDPSADTYDQMEVQQYSGSGDAWVSAIAAMDFIAHPSPYIPASGFPKSEMYSVVLLDDGTFGQVNAFPLGFDGLNFPIAAYCQYNLSAPPATATPNYWDGAQFKLPGNAFH